MAEQSESYKEVKVSIVEDEEAFELKIGGKPIPWVNRTRSGKYEAARYPHARFDSALDLAKFVIDQSDWQD